MKKRVVFLAIAFAVVLLLLGAGISANRASASPGFQLDPMAEDPGMLYCDADHTGMLVYTWGPEYGWDLYQCRVATSNYLIVTGYDQFFQRFCYYVSFWTGYTRAACWMPYWI
jgi:hypothetical protein